MKLHQLLGAIALVSVSTAVLAQATSYPAGYLCCNMRTDGSWISDINYQDKNAVFVCYFGSVIRFPDCCFRCFIFNLFFGIIEIRHFTES